MGGLSPQQVGMKVSPVPSESQYMRLAVYAVAILGSVAFSLWQIYSSDLINQDAVHYLQAAAGDADSARYLNNWLFYPWLIRSVSEGLGLELLQAAHLINLSLNALLMYTFLRVVEQFNGNLATLGWAALILLSLPYLNDNRAEIIRGHGYWAFSMLGLLYYVRLFRAFSWWRLAGWSFSMMLATLFRIEGLIILCVAPLGLLLNSQLAWQQRFASLLKTGLPLLLGLLGLLLMYLFVDTFQNRLLEVHTSLGKLGHALLENVPRKAALLRQEIFPGFSSDGAVLSVYIILLAMIIKDFVESMSLPFFLIWLLRRSFPAAGLAREATPIVGFFVLANFAILIPYILLHFIMVSRYTLMLSLLLLIVVAFALAELQRQSRVSDARKTRFLYRGVVLLMVLMLLAGLKVSTSKKLYVLDASSWMQQNLPHKALVATDYQHHRLEYYINYHGSGRSSADYIEVKDVAGKKVQLGGFDYFMLRVKAGEQVNNTAISVWLNSHGEKLHEVLDAKGNGYFIYRATSDAGSSG